MADKLLKSIKFPTLPDRYVIGDSTLTEEGAAADAKAVGDALATKADTKGRYGDLIVGGAEQLMADEYETDTDPYLFRPTGGSADVGNREYLDKIVGGTVAWNQLVQNGNFANTSGWSTYLTTLSVSNNVATVTVGSSTATNANINRQVSVPSGHKFLILFDVKQINGTKVKYYINDGGVQIEKTITQGVWTNIATIRSASSNTSTLYLYPESVVNNEAQFKNVNIIDLTAMFGSTIADYIYSLEQSSAGAGVAWFRNYFQKDYYPYDPGTLRSVEGVSAHEMVGFNQWDEEWESGYIDASGVPTSSSANIRAKNYCDCLPNTSYCIHNGTTETITFFEYDGNKNYVDRWSAGAGVNRVITTSANTRYFKVSTSAGVTTYNHDICINLSDPSRNGEYEPYQKHTYPLDSSLTLRGVPKLVDGKLAFDGDVYPPSGEVQRRYGLVDLGTLNWSSVTSIGGFGAIVTGMKIVISQSIADIVTVCDKYPSTGKTYTTLGDKELTTNMANYSSSSWVIIKDATYTDAASFKAAMSGVMLVYELSTPTTETADGYEQYQICDQSGTEEFATTGIVPVGHETRYPHDLKKKIETAPDSPSADGTYLMKRSGGKNTYMALPSTPSANGAYVLTVTVSGGSASYSWTAKE